MPKPQPAAPAATVALYDKVVATLPGVTRKGAMLPYTSLNGHMFSVVAKDGHVALRLPADLRDAFLKKYKTSLSVQYGCVLPEYVVVPEGLLKKTSELQPYFAASRAYVASLKPKPTRAKSGATAGRGTKSAKT